MSLSPCISFSPHRTHSSHCRGHHRELLRRKVAVLVEDSRLGVRLKKGDDEGASTTPPPPAKRNSNHKIIEIFAINDVLNFSNVCLMGFSTMPPETPPSHPPSTASTPTTPPFSMASTTSQATSSPAASLPWIFEQLCVRYLCEQYEDGGTGMAIEFHGRVVPVEDELKMVLDGGCQRGWGACNGKGEGKIKMREKEDKMVILLNHFDFFN